MKIPKLSLLVLLSLGTSWAETHPFTVDASTVGSGTVELSPLWPRYALGERVAIKAVPAAGFRFSGWATDSGYFAPKDSIVFDRSLKVKAVFLDTAEMVFNGDFLQGLFGWSRWGELPLVPVFSIRGGEACILPGGKGKPTNVQFFQPVRPMVAEVDYRLKFRIHSSANRPFQVLVRDNSNGWTVRKGWYGVVSTTTPTDFCYDFRLATGTSIPRLTFELGADSAEICLDNISLRAVPSNLVAPPASKEEGVLLASVRDRLTVQALAGSSWELRSIDGRALMGGVFEQGGKQILPDIPRATSFLVLRAPEGQVRSFRVVRF